MASFTPASNLASVQGLVCPWRAKCQWPASNNLAEFMKASALTADDQAFTKTLQSVVPNWCLPASWVEKDDTFDEMSKPMNWNIQENRYRLVAMFEQLERIFPDLDVDDQEFLGYLQSTVSTKLTTITERRDFAAKLSDPGLISSTVADLVRKKPVLLTALLKMARHRSDAPKRIDSPISTSAAVEQLLRHILIRTTKVTDEPGKWLGVMSAVIEDTRHATINFRTASTIDWMYVLIDRACRVELSISPKGVRDSVISLRAQVRPPLNRKKQADKKSFDSILATYLLEWHNSIPKIGRRYGVAHESMLPPSAPLVNAPRIHTRALVRRTRPRYLPKRPGPNRRPVPTTQVAPQMLRPGRSRAAASGQSALHGRFKSTVPSKLSSTALSASDRDTK